MQQSRKVSMALPRFTVVKQCPFAQDTTDERLLHYENHA